MSFAAPATQSGDSLDAKDIVGQLLVAIGTELVKDVTTEFGVTDAIRADVAVLTQQNEADGSYGVVYRDILWFNVSLRNTLKKQIGASVLARMGQGEKQPGKNAPFILVDATQDAQAVTFAEAWMDQHPEFEKEAVEKVGGSTGFAAPATPPAPSVPSVPAVPQVPSVPVAASVPTTPGTPAPAPIQYASAPTASAGPDLSVLANLPAEEQAKLLALLQAQQS